MRMPRRRPLKYCYVTFYLTLILLFFHPIIFTEKTFFFRDIHRWFYPMKHYLSAALKNGSLPFWCPNYFCGSPFMSDIWYVPVSLFFKCVYSCPRLSGRLVFLPVYP